VFNTCSNKECVIRTERLPLAVDHDLARASDDEVELILIMWALVIASTRCEEDEADPVLFERLDVPNAFRPLLSRWIARKGPANRR